MSLIPQIDPAQYIKSRQQRKAAAAAGTLPAPDAVQSPSFAACTIPIIGTPGAVKPAATTTAASAQAARAVVGGDGERTPPPSPTGAVKV